jgi:beta-lactamase superfamily II metal-dependent hydrolase
MIRGGTPNVPFLIRQVARALPWIVGVSALGALALSGGILLRRGCQSGLPANRLIITVMNVGQGEAAWVRTPGGKFIVIGGGPPGRGAEVAGSLREAGADRIALLILPYPYAEAIGGVPDLLKAFTVDSVLEPGGPEINQWQSQVRTLLDAKQARLRAVHAGDAPLVVDGLQIEVLGPPAALVTTPPVGANNSLVLRMTWRDTRLLWCGGIERRGEVELLSRLPNLSAQWLRVAHFGTREATSPEFLRLVSPEIAVISVGPNRNGYPHAETLNRLQASGTKVYRTDAQPGSLRFVSDGAGVNGP